MNPALPLSLLFAATVSAAAWVVFPRSGASSPRASRGLLSKQHPKLCKAGKIPAGPAESSFNTYPQARPGVTTSEPGDGASRSNLRTGARASLGVPPSAETNFAARPARRLGGLFWRSLQNTKNVVHGARLTADEQPLQSRPRDLADHRMTTQRAGSSLCSGGPLINCRVEKMASRLAHNQEVAGSSPAPATTVPLTGLVATPRLARRLAPLPAWALLVSTLSQ